MKKITFLSAAIALSLITASAQITYSDNELFEEGTYFMNRLDYTEAVYFLKQLANTYPENAHYNFLAGECYLNIEGQEQLAIPYLKKATKSIVSKKDYRKKAFDETNAPLHAYFYLGNAYRFAGELDKALEVYQIFTDSKYYPYNYNDNIVDNEILACKRANVIKSDAIKIFTVKLPDIINTESAETRPLLSGDGNTMVFVRTMKFYDAIYCTVKDENDDWVEPYNITSQIESDGDFYPVCLNEDGTKMLLSSNRLGSYDLFVSRLQNNKWNAAEKLCNKVCAGEEISATFGFGTDEVFFVSKRLGGNGGYDIYRVIYDRVKLKWQKPQIVDKLSSEFDEHAIYYNKSCQTMFFSSKGFNNMGGYDIFYSKGSGLNWETPVNIGYPINTTRDDLYFQPLNGCKSGLMAVRDTIPGSKPDIALIRIEQ